MYLKDFIVTLEVNGQTCREFHNDSGGKLVYVPFGSDYAIYLSNTRNTRALVKVKIDDTEVTSGGLVIPPNGSTVLTGKIDGSVTKNKFRFIRKTERIKEVRGDKPKDSVVEVQVMFEKPIEYKFALNNYNNIDLYKLSNIGLGYTGAKCNSIIRACSNQFSCSTSQPEGGLTVPGTPTNVEYKDTMFRESDDITSVSFFLTGTNPDNMNIKSAVTTRQKRTCPTCKFLNVSTNRFCCDCGTCLV